MTSRMNLRDKIYLIGNYSQQIIGSKLPSNKQVLSVLFYNLRLVKLNLRDSARLAIQEVLIFWEKARIPTREVKHCIAKLEALYGEWRTLRKHAGRANAFHKQEEIEFVSKFNVLFDIAHASALDMITIEEDKQFLISQRQKDRPGYMSGIDFKNIRKEKRKEREAKALARKQSSNNQLEKARESVLMETSSSNNTSNEVTVDDVNFQEQAEVEHSNLEMESGPSKKRGICEIMTTKLVAVFDKYKISNRDAVHILIAAVEAFELDNESLVINRSSIHQYHEHCKMRILHCKIL